MRSYLAVLLAAMVFVAIPATKAADTNAELEKLRQDIDDIRKKLNQPAPGMRSSVDKAVDGKYGPNAAVTTKSGKLTISGLVQVWYYSIENDNKGLFNGTNEGGTILDTNETQDNDSFAIRRTEIKFTVDIHENVTGVIMIDPAREVSSRPNPFANQGLIKRRNNVAFQDDGDPVGSLASVSAVQQGSGTIPRLLQDAYVNFHGIIPHHDYSIGQFKPAFGEEGIRSSAQLDFAERSFVGQLGDKRDLGIQMHGTWWDDRFQYWIGAFNGAGNYYGSAGDFQNRSDDNDEKDFSYRVLLRPLWKNETWGSIELGFSSIMGTHGESAGQNPLENPVNGLNRNQSWAIRHAGWMSYMPGGPVKGLWLRGEWGYIKDRHAPGSVLDIANEVNQDAGKPFSSTGWYAAIGYKMQDSIFADCNYSWLKPLEFLARYDTFENVHVADLNVANHTDNFKTNVWTAGINYYIKGHDAKIQLNYNIVDDPESNNEARPFHDVRNNSFVVNFQVAF